MYAHVENGSITHRGALPRNWRNISGLNKSDGNASFLKPLGWVPLVTVPVTLGPDETMDGEDVAIGADSVTVTELKRAMTAGEIASRDSDAALAEINRLEAEMTPRRMREHALGIEEPVNWLADQDALIVLERAKLS
jgi:hypothetical protein|tara:strand:- start:169 stop:579 length:411 start_codon:yes stop_codon:yes gene_type:complete